MKPVNVNSTELYKIRILYNRDVLSMTKPLNFLNFKNLLTLCFIIFSYNCVNAQDLNLKWAKQMGGTNSEGGNGITVDGSGNVYTTGYLNGIADFDPGTGTFYLTSFGSKDIFVSKLDANGNFLWAKQMGGTDLDAVYSIAVDGSGNVYTTGYFYGKADFDPGTGTFYLNSYCCDNTVFVSKLDANGNFLWAKQIGDALNFDFLGAVGYSITVDGSGNVYTTGYFKGTTDFDPGTGTYNLISAGYEDIFVSKLDVNGNFVWAKQMGGNNYSGDYGYSIAVDKSGNVYTTGYFNGTADFNPGTGTFNITSFGSKDMFVSKLDANGNFLWAKQMGGTDIDEGSSVSVDGSGNVYTTGYFKGTADFDPGTGYSIITSFGYEDIFAGQTHEESFSLYVG